MYLYLKVLGNGSMKPSILKAHFTSHHPAHVHGNPMSVQAKRALFRAARTLPILESVSEDTSGLKASYYVDF